MQSLDIHGYSYCDRSDLMHSLTDSLADSGAWITDRSVLSPSATELHFEIQLSYILDLYTALMATGLELTRSTHLAMTDLWTCWNNMQTSGNDIVTARLEVNFLQDLTLPSLLAKASLA